MLVDPTTEDDWFEVIEESVEQETENWSESMKMQLSLIEAVL